MADKEISLSPGAPAPKPVNAAEKQVPTTPQTPPVQTAPTPPQAKLKSDASQADVVDFLISRPQDELIPWNDAILPSLGLYYDGFIPGGKIKVKAMSITSEKIMATARLVQTGQSLDEVFKRCVRFPDPNFDTQELLVGDRAFLLFVLRGLTHGNIYEFTIKCANEDCGISLTESYDLNVVNQTVRNPQHQSEPVKIVLPYYSQQAGRDVYVEARFMRGRDMAVIGKRKKQLDRMFGQHAQGKNKLEEKDKQPVQTPLDQSIEENLNLLIVNVNGVTDRGKISRIVANMHSKDSAAIREIIRDQAPGIETEIEVHCPQCGLDMTMELPVTETFFRPKNVR